MGIFAAEGDSYKVLTIGNSFSVDALIHQYRLVKELGATDVKIGSLYIGSCTLSMHYENMKANKAAYTYYKYDNSASLQTIKETKMLDAIKECDWDVIVLQHGTWETGSVITFSRLPALIKYVRENATNPDVKIAWHHTWAYQQDIVNEANDRGFSKFDNDQMKMYNAQVAAVKEAVLTAEGMDLVIPSGTAIQNLRTSFFGDHLTRDCFHMSYGAGRYTAALMYIKTLTDYDISKVTYIPTGDNITDISTEVLPAIIEAVNNAAANPYEVTESVYKTKADLATAVTTAATTTAAATTSAQPEQEKKSNTALYIILAAVALIAVCVLLAVIFKKKKA